MSFYLTHHTSPLPSSFLLPASALPLNNRPHITVRVAHISYPVCLFLLQAPDQTRISRKRMKTKDKLDARGSPCDKLAQRLSQCAHLLCHRGRRKEAFASTFDWRR